MYKLKYYTAKGKVKQKIYKQELAMLDFVHDLIHAEREGKVDVVEITRIKGGD